MLAGQQIMRRTRSISSGMGVEVMTKSDDHRVNPVRAMQMCPEVEEEEAKFAMNLNKDLDLDLDDEVEVERLRVAKGMVSSKSHSGSPTATTCKPIPHTTTPHFLHTCGLCKRHLAPSRDIYMYRGDTAFCSSECREEHMRVEERKDKGKVSSTYKKQDRHHTASSNPNSSSKPSNSNKAQTMAAA